MIDAHIHVVPPNLPGVGPLDELLLRSVDEIAVALKRQMLLAGATMAFAMGEWNGTPDDPLGIASTCRIAERVPGLHPIGICDPTRGDDPEHLAAVESELKRSRVVALKCYLGYLHYEPSHANYRRYYELAGHYGVPVVFHTGDTHSSRAKLKYAHPLGIDDVAVDHPETKFVLAHVGNPWMIDAAEVVYKNPNVWAEVSGLVVSKTGWPSEGDILADIASRLTASFRYAERPDRFLFGTDWPLIGIAEYARFIRRCIPEEFHAGLFEANARTIYRIPS